MKKSIPVISSIIFCIIIFTSCSNSLHDKYTTGLIVYKEFDKSRIFDTTSNSKSPAYYRPVKIDMFYPSIEKTGKAALTYGDILDMYEQRMNYNTSIDSCKKVSATLAKIFGDYLHADSSKILAYKTAIFKDIRVPEKKLPLIIYAAGMNGSSWENPILFDSLTKAGYVVAAISSVGKFPGFMSGAVDLDEQVEDILFAKQKMAALPFIDTSKIGLLSWSLGGSAISKAAMISKDFKCLLSFDGTEIHYYGFDTAWDNEYNVMKLIPPFNPASINIPYLYLSSEHPKKIDSIYILPAHIISPDKYFLQFKNGTHEDFSSLITIGKNVTPGLGNIDSSRHQVVCGLTLTFFNQYLKQSNTVTTADYINKLVAGKPGFYSTSYPEK
ncbi:MAG: hypothetical protein ABI707_02720 [Ferruginibacter sp.]